MEFALAPNEVGVWYDRTDAVAALDSKFHSILSDDERSRCSRFVFATDRRDFAAAHALLRTALSACGHLEPAEWQFEINAYGKPSIVESQQAGRGLSFNLSHTHGLVACAVTCGVSVGIDVEHGGRGGNAREIAGRYFAAEELEMLKQCRSPDEETRFVELWTLKESYIKAVGAGLSLPLDSFGFGFEGASGLRFTAREDKSVWQFWLAGLSSFRLAVAVAGAGPYSLRYIPHHRETTEASPPLVLLRSTSRPALRSQPARR